MNTNTLSLPDYAVHHPVATANGTTVFLLHGAFGAKEYWRSQLQALVGAGYRVVSWDAPGYGLSALPVPLTIDHCARVLALLLEREGGKRNVVMGHSMGGMIAQQAWRHAREHIHGYVLSATSASFGKPDRMPTSPTTRCPVVGWTPLCRGGRPWASRGSRCSPSYGSPRNQDSSRDRSKRRRRSTVWMPGSVPHQPYWSNPGRTIRRSSAVCSKRPARRGTSPPMHTWPR